VKIRLLYFASLADRAGRSAETRDTSAATPKDLYAEVSREHAFALSTGSVRVAINGAFAGWDRALAEDDEVVFLPPVSGG
jgi:molybdopterin synthase sulfur carrier subunit